jgi:uncharacterized membrane protein
MIAGGAAHLAAPERFAPLEPAFLSATPVIFSTGVVQIIIGLGALLPGTRNLAALAFAALCATYLPLHQWDSVRPDPMFAPPVAASIRVAVQLAFIVAGYTLWQRTRQSVAPVL